MSNNTITSLLIVDDEEAVRARLLRVARRVLPQALCAEAASLAEARSQLGQVRFSLVLLDVNLPDGSGLALLPWLRAHAPRTEAVVVSSLGDDATVLQALRGGAVGYLLKIGSDDEMAFSLASLARGGAPIDPLIARRILDFMSAAPVAPAAAPAADVAGESTLTEREKVVLQWVARGHSNREIARELNLSVNTIECHAKAIYRKLSVRSRAAAVFNARAQGLLP
ncbi:LuxR C-terminal-related transcriptional regulator [Variovorax terrae]|uniref:Response regulator transcription factor n=1 Tax=Variovorax terrae TaxID=2923278 RepID=A0A9X1VWY3_9BURK|nr:response regulator transcription factor [Variovorax terrae]MCJ0763427.1 response regulator transcription factor [Variovorax terrae]